MDFGTEKAQSPPSPAGEGRGEGPFSGHLREVEEAREEHEHPSFAVTLFDGARLIVRKIQE